MSMSDVFAERLKWYWTREGARLQTEDRFDVRIEPVRTNSQDWDWCVYVSEAMIVGPYPGSPDDRVLWDAAGTARSPDEAKWEAWKSLRRFMLIEHDVDNAEILYAEEYERYKEPMTYFDLSPAEQEAWRHEVGITLTPTGYRLG